MLRCLRPLVIAATALAADAGAQVAPPAPQQPASPGGEVTVIAPKPIERGTAKHFVTDVSVPEQDQLARYNVPVCPAAWGFPPRLRDQIVARLREDIEAVGAVADKPGCKANLLVIATKDGADLVRTARTLRSPILDGIDSHEQGRLAASHEPARSWNVIDRQDEDGFALRHEVGEGIKWLVVHDASRLRMTTRESILFAVAVLEWPALIGKSSTQIADYAAMRTLARTKASGSAAADTILRLFPPAGSPQAVAAPASLTAVDRGYLHSLYTMSDYVGWRRQYDTIASDVARPVPATAR